MNMLVLLAGMQPWRAMSPTSMLTRVLVAVSALSIEAQIATLAGLGTIESMLPVTGLLAVGAFVLWRPGDRENRPAIGMLGGIPALAVIALASVVVTLDLARPLEAADPYHLDKIDRIARTGTLEYDVATETKINILNSTYELVLADLRLVPAVGSWLVRLHGLLGLALYLIALGSARELLEAARRPDQAGERRAGTPMSTHGAGSWRWALLLVVPVVFHQLVLVKNDLFVGAISLVVVAWALTRASVAPWREVVWASWLAGLAVAVKLTTLPLAAVVAGAVVLQRDDRWRAMTGVVWGGVLGAVAGGLVFVVVENLRVYGSPMPVQDIGGSTGSLTDVLIGIPRFALSLVDLGQVTPRVWPGRGGWGSTFGLPLLWALVVLAACRERPLVRRALVMSGLQFVVFAVAFLDADLAQRLVLGPGLLLIVVAVDALDDGPSMAALRLALWPVGLLSSAQIVRSAFLYLQTS